MPIPTQTQNPPSALFNPELAAQGVEAVKAADKPSTVEVAAPNSPEQETKVTVGEAVKALGMAAVERILPPTERGRHVKSSSTDTDQLLVAAGSTGLASVESLTILPPTEGAQDLTSLSEGAPTFDQLIKPDTQPNDAQPTQIAA